MRARSQTASYSKLVVPVSAFRGISIVKLMRDKTNVEARYNQCEEDDNRLDESKEDDTPVAPIAKLVERNGINSNVNLL